MLKKIRKRILILVIKKKGREKNHDHLPKSAD
jgi:hypothetical protein